MGEMICAGVRRLAGRAVLAIGVLGLMTGTVQAQGTVKSVHGDWQVRCDTPPGAQDRKSVV